MTGVIENFRDKRISKARNLTLAAGALISINAVLLGIATTWFPWVMPTLPGSTDNSAIAFGNLVTIGLVCGILVLFCGLMLRGKALNSKVWGIVIIVFSTPSVIMGGGFIIGFILGTVGGVTTLQNANNKTKKITD